MFYIEGAYDFVDVRDVVDGMMLAEAKGRSGESYLLSGHKMTVRDLIEMVRGVTGKAFTSIKIPLNLAEFASKITPAYYRLTKAKPRLTPYSLEVLQSNSNISHAKATRELGFHPRPLAETIADTVRWFIENRHLKSAA
jgi:dihydroflavonol-4-reductase